MSVSRFADACPECGERVEPVVVLPAGSSRGVDCLYSCGCNRSTWTAVIAYPIEVDNSGSAEVA